MSIHAWALRLLAAATIFCAAPATLLAQDGQDAAAFVQSLNFRTGTIEVPEAKARFNLDPEFRYLDQADARRVLEELWGNPPDTDVLGLIVPRSPALDDDESWAVVVTYADDGYVSDEDAAGIDYGKLLRDMQAQIDEANPAREEAGYGTLRLVGWAVPPRYDSANNKLYWAKELEFGGQSTHVLNYGIRVLGRHGYLSLNAVSGMEELPLVRTGMERLLPMAEFEQGARYADHNPKTDRIAAYGVATLIGGGLAAKAGLFAKLGLLFAKFWKLLLIGAVALVGLGRKLLGNRREGGTVR